MPTSYTLALRVAGGLLAAASCMAQSITGVVYDEDGSSGAQRARLPHGRLC